MFDIREEWFGRVAIRHFPNYYKATVMEIYGSDVQWRVGHSGDTKLSGRASTFEQGIEIAANMVEQLSA